MRTTLLPTLLLALSLPSAAHASEAGRLPSLGTPATLAVNDARPSDQRGDGHLGWYSNEDGDLRPTGPEDFSLRATVEAAFATAGAGLGVPVHPGAAGEETHHLQVQVLQFWCEDTVDWSSCTTEIETTLDLPDGDPYSFRFMESSDDRDWRTLREGLESQLLVELARAQSERGLGASHDVSPSTHPLLRFGWIEQADGSRNVGTVGNGEGGVCISARDRMTFVPLEEIIDVRVVDVPLVGAQRGSPWAVLGFPDGSWVGGRVLTRDTIESGDVLLRTLGGARRIPADLAGRLVEGDWSNEEPSCINDVIGGSPMVTGTALERPRPSGDSAVDPEETPLVYANRDGQIEILDEGLETVWAVRQGRIGQRRWRRYRLSWAAYARMMRSDRVNAELENWIDSNRAAKARWNGVMIGGIGMTIGSGVGAGVLSTVAWTETTNVDTQTAASVATPFVAHGIGAGIVTTVIAAVARAKAGKKADRPDRYYNLLDFLSVEDLEAAMEQYEE